jgi:phycoerythrin-associated linker protein
MATMARTELWATRSIEDVQSVIRAVYKQVLGNAHVMESERLTSAESQLCDGSLSVREFVRAVGKSDFYRARHFEQCAPYRFVELNFMHFLGRPPQSQLEVSAHTVRCVAEGYDAEIDSYIDSDEYAAAFGDNVVPFNRGTNTESGQRQVTYNRMVAIDRGPAQLSSAVKSSQLVYSVGTNSTSKIAASGVNLGGAGAAKTFKIVVSGGKSGGARRISTTQYMVTTDRMTAQIQQIHRSNGRIVSITEMV